MAESSPAALVPAGWVAEQLLRPVPASGAGTTLQALGLLQVLADLGAGQDGPAEPQVEPAPGSLPLELAQVLADGLRTADAWLCVSVMQPTHIENLSIIFAGPQCWAWTLASAGKYLVADASDPARGREGVAQRAVTGLLGDRAALGGEAIWASDAREGQLLLARSAGSWRLAGFGPDEYQRTFEGSGDLPDGVVGEIVSKWVAS